MAAPRSSAVLDSSSRSPLLAKRRPHFKMHMRSWNEKNMIVGPYGVRNYERVCWQGSVANHLFCYVKLSSGGVKFATFTELRHYSTNHGNVREPKDSNVTFCGRRRYKMGRDVSPSLHAAPRGAGVVVRHHLRNTVSKTSRYSTDMKEKKD